jgi:sec-independent protein translocase protein TatB
MPSLGPMEILVVLVVALLVFGPNKLPEVARGIGKFMREFNSFREHVMGEINDVMKVGEENDGTPPILPAKDTTDIAAVEETLPPEADPPGANPPEPNPTEPNPTEPPSPVATVDSTPPPSVHAVSGPPPGRGPTPDLAALFGAGAGAPEDPAGANPSDPESAV